MARTFAYHVRPDADGDGWIVAAEGYVVHSLAYDTIDDAIDIAKELTRMHPGSAITLDAKPRPFTPIEIEHRLSA